MSLGARGDETHVSLLFLKFTNLKETVAIRLYLQQAVLYHTLEHVNVH